MCLLCGYVYDALVHAHFSERQHHKTLKLYMIWLCIVRMHVPTRIWILYIHAVLYEALNKRIQKYVCDDGDVNVYLTKYNWRVQKNYLYCARFSAQHNEASVVALGEIRCVCIMYIKDILRTHIHTYVLNVFALAIFTTIYFLFIYYLSRRFNLTCKNYSSAIFSGKKKMLVSGAATAPVSSIYICRSAYTCTNVQYIQNTHAYIFSISRGEHNDRVRWWYTHLCNKRKKAKKKLWSFCDDWKTEAVLYLLS